jgi:hypothetical protein
VIKMQRKEFFIFNNIFFKFNDVYKVILLFSFNYTNISNLKTEQNNKYLDNKVVDTYLPSEWYPKEFVSIPGRRLLG